MEEGIIKVKILKGCITAQNKEGKILKIEGFEITRDSGIKVFYDKDSSFYKAVTFEGITLDAYYLAKTKIMLC